MAVVVGGSAAAATTAALRGPGAGAPAFLVAGVVMMSWITGEVLLLHQPTRPTWLEVLYFAVGVAMTGLALMVRRAEHRGQLTSQGAWLPAAR